MSNLSMNPSSKKSKLNAWLNKDSIAQTLIVANPYKVDYDITAPKFIKTV